MNLEKAWDALYEGDLELLATELGVLKEDTVGNNQENERLHQAGGEDGRICGPYTGIEKGGSFEENGS